MSDLLTAEFDYLYDVVLTQEEADRIAEDIVTHDTMRIASIFAIDAIKDGNVEETYRWAFTAARNAHRLFT